MENASKALIIAGGILLALLVVSLLLYMILNVRKVRQAEADTIEAKQLQEFNQEYEAYNKRVMYGAEVLSVINKINDNNERYKNNSDFQINYILLDGCTLDEIRSNKTKEYKCTGITYSSTTGRVKTMTFSRY